MASEKEIYLDVDPEARLEYSNSLGDYSIFTLDTLPHLSLQCPDPSAIIIPALTFAAFNPASLDQFQNIKENDMIQVSTDLDHKIYKSWNPPAEFLPERGKSTMYKVRLIVEDALGYPIIVGSEVL